jgi:hypothetical protein
VPASGAQVGGNGKHRPSLGGACVQTAPSGPASRGAPASPFDPSAGSQYSPAAQSFAEWHGLPGITHMSKRHTEPPLQHWLPHTFAADAQHVPVDVMQTPPLQSVDETHAPVSVNEITSDDPSSVIPASPWSNSDESSPPQPVYEASAINETKANGPRTRRSETFCILQG